MLPAERRKNAIFQVSGQVTRRITRTCVMDDVTSLLTQCKARPLLSTYW